MADRQYELVYILPPDSTEQQVAELHTQIEGAVSKMNGAIEKTENWGRRRLAYEIDHKPESAYHLLTFDAAPETLDEVSRVLRITDGVMRHLAVRRVKGASTNPPEPSHYEPEQPRREEPRREEPSHEEPSHEEPGHEEPSQEEPLAASVPASQDSEPEETAREERE